MIWTILKLIEWTTEYFTKHEIPNPRLDTELLLAHTLNKKRIDLYLSFDYVVPEKELAVFKGHVQRRVKREPLQYILGTQDFCGVQIKITPDVLIPRPETEILVEEVFKYCHSEAEGRKIPHNQSHSGDPSPPAAAQDDIRILDLCTGSGAIIAVLASKLPNAHFVGTDISEKALAIARENIEKWKDRVELLCGDLFEPLLASNLDTPNFELIISNPPYIPDGEWAGLQPEVRDFEPRTALLAGEDGLAIIKQIVNNAHKFLKPGGILAMEISNGQASSICKMIVETKYYNEPKLVKDYGGVERIIIMQITNDQIPSSK